MRLTKLKLAGFKSFVDPTTISFPSNLVAIVGPNGCGKSNIIDAVRWVMGESSAKHLRGDSMADVIFNGSNTRKPVGRASVELLFDNTEGKLGGQYARFSEISVRREVVRDGTSHYYLNGRRCRRRDIMDVFLGTGLGPRSYSIIEQGTISRLIEARPEELRVFLEEAAGISKYKERRRETEHRMRHTLENLARLEDLRQELAKQLEKLKRQARTAERYRELKAEERRVRGELILLRHRALAEALDASRERIHTTELAVEETRTRLRAIERELETLRVRQAEAGEAHGEVQARYYEAGAEIARLEQSLAHARQNRERQERERREAERALSDAEAHLRTDRERIAGLEAELERLQPELERARRRAEASGSDLRAREQALREWQADWEAFHRERSTCRQNAEVERTRLDQLARQQERIRARLARIDDEARHLDPAPLAQERAALAEEIARVEGQLADREGERARLQAAIEAERVRQRELAHSIDTEARALQADRGRLASLETLQQAALGKDDARLQAWLRDQGLEAAPRLVERLEVEPGWERAVETVLGHALEAVCVEELDALVPRASDCQGEVLSLWQGRAAVESPAPDSLAAKVRAPWPLSSLLAGVRTADTLEEALARRPALEPGESLVLPDGLWLGPDWLRQVRPGEGRGGLLEREQAIRTLSATLEQRERRLAGLREEAEAVRARLAECERRRDAVQGELHALHRRHHELRGRQTALNDRLEQLTRRREALEAERVELGAQQEELEAEAAAARTRLHEALEALERLAEEQTVREQTRERLEGALEAVRSQARQDQEALHRLTVKVESTRTALAETRQSLERMTGQMAHLRQRSEQLQLALEEGVHPLRELESAHAEALERRAAAEEALRRARGRVQEIEHALRQAEEARMRTEARLGELQERLHAAHLARRELEVRDQALLEQLPETGHTLEALAEGLPEGADIPAWSERLAEIEARLQRLGSVNLTAIEEYEKERRRKEYLDAQHADLSEALETLQSAIRKIDRETRTRFRETFDRVNAGLQRMFPRLFGGGQAYLEMTGEDLLDTGVVVMARPPGKRNSSIHLLSGGEKALTAVALVFSIFELNPSPFCMLDEVDAPLDDANVGRFCDLVREMSERVQFIFITHNKITMEMAHQLTGVTMHEPGVSRLVAVDIDEAARMAAV
ncbi:MAG: chromosome segregation protein SMC [Gammaproteobacteria bacterium]|nr:MAG: chromosome segregation protein SMC [Gammaproteobacteria bacterium]